MSYHSMCNLLNPCLQFCWRHMDCFNKLSLFTWLSSHTVVRPCSQCSWTVPRCESSRAGRIDKKSSIRPTLMYRIHMLTPSFPGCTDKRAKLRQLLLQPWWRRFTLAALLLGAVTVAGLARTTHHSPRARLCIKAMSLSG